LIRKGRNLELGADIMHAAVYRVLSFANSCRKMRTLPVVDARAGVADATILQWTSIGYSITDKRVRSHNPKQIPRSVGCVSCIET